MKKSFILTTALAAVLSATAIMTSAVGFSKVNTYSTGMFKDVPSGQWYAEYVSSAYELGFMKGSSGTTFEPEGNMTVAEAITIVSRVNDTYNATGTKFNQSEGNNWYDCYIKYATDTGIIAADQFDNYDRNITRAEMAKVFAKAVPADFLAAKNNITEIPDVPSTNSYFNELKLLYNAGVITGNDDFGTFKPTSNITRAEAAAIIGRIALPEKRQSKVLVDANYGDAYYLIDQGTATSLSSGAAVAESPWQYDNRNRLGVVSNMADHITDYYDDKKVELWRDIEDVTEGLLSWEFQGNLADADNGAFFMITDDDRNAVVNLATDEGKFVINGTKTDVDVPKGSLFFIIDADLDTGKGTLYIHGEKVTDFTLGKYTASRVYIGSTDEGMAQITIIKLDMYTNYLANDRFVAPENAPLARWEVTGDTAIVYRGGQNYADVRSAVLRTDATAKKTFNKVSGDIVFQTIMLFRNEEDSAYISLNSGNVSAAKLVINKDGIFKANGTKLRHHTNNVWQTLRIELDTVNGTVVYKINGKTVYEGVADASCATVDNISVVNTGGVVFFDDVEVYMTHEYDDYCPVPQPITDDGYDVIMNMCSLWREGQHFGWGAISGYPDIENALGYYDEGIVEVADWEIKFMVENGIDVQHLCWYSPSADIKEPIKKSDMNDALHYGFFNAKYSDLMKFTFMWENTSINCKSLDQFKDYIWKYWMEYYFLDDRFYTIDNNIVFTVWSYNNFKSAFGDTVEGCLEAVEWMNEDAKAHGFDGVMIFFADGHAQDATNLANMAAIGGTATYAYHWQQDGIYANKTIPRLDRNQNYGKIHVVPTVSVGFNNIGWTGIRKPLASIEDHRTVLEHIKNVYLPKLEGWKSNTLIISTWNEFGEGTYVAPVEELHGFGYLENIAEVISGVTDHSNNIYPTEQQKARLGHLYPDSKTSMKHLDTERDSKANAATTTTYMFTGNDLQIYRNIESFSVESGIAKVVGKHDNSFYLKNLPENGINAEEIVTIKVYMRSDNEANAQIFFMTDSEPDISEENSFVFKVSPTSDFVGYTIDTTTKDGWKGVVNKMRFDPLYTAGSYEIQRIEFLAINKDNIPISLIIDDVTYEGPFFPYEEDGEIYLATDAKAGFYSLSNIYYEWSRKTGELYLLTKNNREIEFKVGSDIALVDGVETKLAKAVNVRDGLPVLPLKFIYDISELTYSIEDKVFTVSTLDPKYQAIIDARVPYSYEFEVPGDLEGFVPAFMTGVVSGGVLKGSAIERTGQNPVYDPMLKLNDIAIDTMECNKIVISMKHSFIFNNSSLIQVFFTTKTDGKLNQEKSATVSVPGKVSDGFVEYVIDFSDNEYWTGTITSVRIDPFHGGGDYEIDYIRFVIDEEIRKANEAKIEAEKKYAAERAESGIVVLNGDAEDASQPNAFFGMANNATVTIVKDEEKDSNVWNVQPASGKVWAYICQNTYYKPGAKYKVSLDIKVTGTATDKTATGTVICNVVYKDSNGAVDHKAHYINNSPNGEWQTVNFEFSVANNIDTSGNQFCFYSNPIDNEGLGYMIDNVVVEMIK